MRDFLADREVKQCKTKAVLKITCYKQLKTAKIFFLAFRLHVLAGVFPGGVDKTDNKLAVLWEETYVKNMKYAAHRLEEVIAASKHNVLF